jgi:hypothetical protein
LKTGCRLFILVLACAGLPKTLPASTISFEYSLPLNGIADEVLAAGQLTVTPAADGAYRITGISGTRSAGGVTQPIEGLLAPGAFDGNDNLVSLNYHYLDHHGFAFVLAGGGGDDGRGDVHVFYISHLGTFSEDDKWIGSGTFDVTPAPEAMPPTGALLTLIFAVRWWNGRR